MTPIAEASRNVEPTPVVHRQPDPETTTTLGRSDVRVSRLGVGAMTWGDPSGMARFHPAKMAYGGPAGIEDERAALDASLAAGVTLFDTAAMYAFGAAERRLGELARGRDLRIATKFPAGMRARADDLPATLEASLDRLGRTSVDLYMHHFPSGRVAIPRTPTARTLPASTASAIRSTTRPTNCGRRTRRWPSAGSRSPRSRTATRCSIDGSRRTGSSTPAGSWASRSSPTSRWPAGP